ncbi:MAG: VanW family protein [Anaerolineales bacterium]
MSFVTQPVRRRQIVSREARPAQAAAAILGGVLLFLLAVLLINGLFQLIYAGRIFPGVSVAGVDLSGLTPDQAALRLSQTLSYPYTGQVLFVDGERVWAATPVQLGMVFDLGATVQEAYALGRGRGMFANLTAILNAIQAGYPVEPVVMIDERVAHAYLQQIVPFINQPMIEADLHLEGAQVVYRPGQVGRVFNVDATMVFLTTRLRSFQEGEVALVIEEQVPRVVDASAQAASLESILSQPLILAIPDMQPGDPGPWTVEPAALAAMLRVERVPIEGTERMEYVIRIDTDALRSLLDQIGEQVDRQAANTRFIFNDDTRQLEPIQAAVTGRALDAEATLTAIETGLLEGQHAIPLALIYTPPEVTETATGESLGITERVSSHTTFFRGSSQARIHNIQTASAQFHGLLVRPGETFSMAEVLGDISLEGGYAEALIIYNGQTIKGVGGGVCQVSTTLFRTAFFGGYPIVERHAHAYRVYYYEQTQYGYDASLAGLDATVYVPLVDFKFTNDTPYWLLMEVWVNPQARSMTWNFYSTSDGRLVTWETTGPRNLVPPPEPLFVMNPELGPDEMRQVDWPAEGADVTVRRVVTRDGIVLYRDTIDTHYTAWQAVCEYGPGMEAPEAFAAEHGYCQP